MLNFSHEKRLISLVIPVYNEENSIAIFLKEVFLIIDPLPFCFEILFIDDGSQDQTCTEIKKSAEIYPNIRYIKLARNFGKEAAMSAGLDYAKGDAVILMDVDLQDPPFVIKAFLDKWEEGFQSVCAIRSARLEDSYFKKTSAAMFYKLFNKISQTPILQNAGDFRLLDRQIVDIVRQLPERNRFMKALLAWPGFRVATISYERPARIKGQSKFNGWKLWNFAVDGFTSFSTWPLRIWSYLGGLIAILSLIYMIILILRTLVFGIDWPGYASIMVGILFFGAIQLISIGILGEYIGRLYIESKARPIYVVESEKTFSNSSAINSAETENNEKKSPSQGGANNPEGCLGNQ